MGVVVVSPKQIKRPGNRVRDLQRRSIFSWFQEAAPNRQDSSFWFAPCSCLWPFLSPNSVLPLAASPFVSRKFSRVHKLRGNQRTVGKSRLFCGDVALVQ